MQFGQLNLQLLLAAPLDVNGGYLELIDGALISI